MNQLKKTLSQINKKHNEYRLIIQAIEQRLYLFNQSTKINDMTFIEDCYNASPTSMSASLSVLESISENRAIAVLGDMKELGAYSAQAHVEVGTEVAANRVDVLFTFGMLAADIAAAASKYGVKNIFALLRLGCSGE